jgi:hypothetical protein
MPTNVVKTVNFGTSKASLSTAGYRIYSTAGALSGTRVTSGVGEVLNGSGIYSGSIHLSEGFIGHILWDTGGSAPVYASEDVDNTLNTLSFISSSIEHTKHMTAGRWQILTASNQMVFYKDDNTTELARYDLFDETGEKSYTSVFQRVKV